MSGVPICERLLRERSHDFARGLLGKHINPDGPEAAATIQALVEAMTPSAETKAAYNGEFAFMIDEGDYGSRIIPVPWTTIKEIMAAIRERALAKVTP